MFPACLPQTTLQQHSWCLTTMCAQYLADVSTTTISVVHQSTYILIGKIFNVQVSLPPLWPSGGS